ncbi:MAG: hypothetical protein ACJ79R_08935, partial [Anaeromyxobacteraceae bacterium]
MSGPRLGRAATVAALLAAAAPAAAFVRSTTGDNPGTGQALWWRARQINVIVNTTAYHGGCATGADAAAAVRASFPTWTRATAAGGAQACTDFTFNDCGDSARADLGYTSGGSDNANIVVFRGSRCVDHQSDSACADPTSSQCVEKFNCWSHDDASGGGGILALTTVTFDVDTGEIVDADMELHGWDGNLASPTGFYFTCASSSTCGPTYGGQNCAAIDVQNTVTHEAGHMLGLDHVCVAGGAAPSNVCPAGAEPTMAPTAGKGDIDKRTLEPDDVAGVCSIYPAAAPTQRATATP